ncbi:MAG: amino acid ABC transporter permease [Candidatus Binatia bacterium]
MVIEVRRRLAPGRSAIWNDSRYRSLFFQTLVLGAVIAFAVFIARNTLENLERRGITSGFDFLSSTAGFGIIVHLIDYSEESSYGRAFLVGLLNTLLVSGLGVVFATILGFLIGICRLSRNWLVAKLATAYIEVIRNIPLLLQIFFWYFAMLGLLPSPRQSIVIAGTFFLNNRGLYLPVPIFDSGFGVALLSFLIAFIAVILMVRWARRGQGASGRHFHTVLALMVILIALPLIAAVVTGFTFSWDRPELKGFNFVGGLVLIPEFVALLVALSVYTAAFIAEIVRAGIQSVSKGQIEAAYSLGLKPAQTLRLVIVPQALRVIVPPLTSQYLNLTKNSSLAVAIAYPELVSVFAGTVLNQTGQAIEVIAMTMAVYLTISLMISLFMNWYNRKIALAER